MPTLDLGAINNAQSSSSTTTTIHDARPATTAMRHRLTVTTHDVVTIHSK